MNNKTMRAIGAGVILAAIAAGALVQTEKRGQPGTIALADNDPVARSSIAVAARDGAPAPVNASVATEPFVYRLGVLSSATTDNYWEFYGSEPSVWNAYILGPTKPALYAARPADGALVPELAAAEVSSTWDEEGWRVRVALNDDMAWSDGTPITAEDMVFTFETVRSLALAGTWAEAFPAAVESMHADTPYDLRIEFSERPGLAVWPHAVGQAPVMARHIWEDAVAAATGADDLYARSGAIDVGGGPVVLAGISSDMAVSLANPGYPNHPSPDRIEYLAYENEEAAVAALDEGQIDTVLSPRGLADSHLQAVANDPAIEVAVSPANVIRYLGFNLNRQPMSEAAFRTSLSLLLDREELAADIPGSTAAYSFVSPENRAWYDPDRAEANAEPYRRSFGERLADAVTLLGDAGYSWASEPTMGPDGRVIPGEGLEVGGRPPAPLTILTSGDAYDPSRPVYAEEIAKVLGWLGFDARPVETDFDSVIDLAFTPNDDGILGYDMYLLGWTLGSPTLPGHYQALFSSDGALNNTGYDSDEFTRALARYESANDHDDAREALWAMEIILARDLPYLLLYTSEITEAYRADRVGFDVDVGLGGIQGRLGGIGDVRPAR